MCRQWVVAVILAAGPARGSHQINIRSHACNSAGGVCILKVSQQHFPHTDRTQRMAKDSKNQVALIPQTVSSDTYLRLPAWFPTCQSIERVNWQWFLIVEQFRVKISLHVLNQEVLSGKGHPWNSPCCRDPSTQRRVSGLRVGNWVLPFPCRETGT